MKKIKKRFKSVVLIPIVLCVMSRLHAQESDVALSPLADALVVSGSFALVLTSELFLGLQKSNVPAVIDICTINTLDKGAVFPYSETADVVSDFTQYAVALSPALLAIGTISRDWLNIGVMYFESTAIAFSVKNILKLAVTRYRPYMYYDTLPAEIIADGDYANSFPSGHSALSFNAATFLTYMFAYYHPKSFWTIPVAVGSYGIAVVTTLLRVTSGSHFVTDVLAGATIGTLSGFLVPFLHMKRKGADNKKEIAVFMRIGINTINSNSHFSRQPLYGMIVDLSV
ncbi:MAG: phosphatase PAP2 family protein [Spirochaetota bacterium]